MILLDDWVCYRKTAPYKQFHQCIGSVYFSFLTMSFTLDSAYGHVEAGRCNPSSPRSRYIPTLFTYIMVLTVQPLIDVLFLVSSY